MDQVLNAVIPLVSVLIGAGLTRWQGSWSRVATAKDQARELLAEHPNRVWDKTPTGWLSLQVYLSRLRGPLRTAGVPLATYKRFGDAAVSFWEAVRPIPDDPGDAYIHDNAVEENFKSLVEQLYAVLEAEPRWRRWRRRAPTHD